VRLVQPRQERPGRERAGINKQQDEFWVVEHRNARHRDSILPLHRRNVEALDLRARQRTRPNGHSRALLEFADTGDHSLSDAAEQVTGRELLADGLRSSLSLVQMRWREEEEREVDLDPAPRTAASLARRLRRALPGRFQGRQTVPIRQASVWDSIADLCRRRCHARDRAGATRGQEAVAPPRTSLVRGGRRTAQVASLSASLSLRSSSSGTSSSISGKSCRSSSRMCA
jgi:hypothetical protein